MQEKTKKSFKAFPKSKVGELYAILSEHIIPKPELQFGSALDLLVAVLLSAQCTDKAVNKATTELWKTVRTPEDYLSLGQEGLEKAIRSIGFHHVKAAHILGLCRKLLDEFNGQVPDSREQLMTLPGVGRKTANVVLNLWFRQETLAVDTHIFRVAHRTGLSNGATPDDVEQDLTALTPKKYLLDAHHYLLLHGRYTCQARAPKCAECPIQALCRKNLESK